MENPQFNFTLCKKDNSARAGLLKTPHGTFETPIFMPVGTRGSVKSLSPQELKECGSKIILGNAYHLFLRPGEQLISQMGGLHNFTSWDRAMLTDSGGFQLMSLSRLCKITDEGVFFQSHIDGAKHFLTPRGIIDIQQKLGADFIMSFDECPPASSSKEYIKQAVKRTIKWAREGKDHFSNSKKQALFGIVQGGVDESLRAYCAEELIKMDFFGYALGGLAVGEHKSKMFSTVAILDKILPENKPRYLMGVGTPQDILGAIARGIDMFDCVLPTRNGRRGSVFTAKGRLVLKAAKYKYDNVPIDKNCGCYTCGNFSRAYIRHLFAVGELLAHRLATIHNLYFYHKLVAGAREAILAGEFEKYYRQRIEEMDGEMA